MRKRLLVDCIYEYLGHDRELFPNRLYINSDECIDCGAGEPECPWHAIYGEPAVPKLFNNDVALNAQIVVMPDQFRVKQFNVKPAPTPEQVTKTSANGALMLIRGVEVHGF